MFSNCLIGFPLMIGVSFLCLLTNGKNESVDFDSLKNRSDRGC